MEGYVVTPYVMGRSLDLNGTTVLIACLFWGFLWGLVGLILAMPITVTMKLVFQHVPELHRWAELMSRDWQPPGLPPPRPCPRPPLVAERGVGLPPPPYPRPEVDDSPFRPTMPGEGGRFGPPRNLEGLAMDVTVEYCAM